MHTVALSLFRIKHSDHIEYRPPVSETLSKLDRNKLQKFAQYLLNELPKSHLSLAQNILDQLLKNQLQVDLSDGIDGAPDPTAGATSDAHHDWLLDENSLRDQVKKTLTKFCSPSPIVSDPSYFSSYPDSICHTEYNLLLRPLRNKEPNGIWTLINIVQEMNMNNDQNAYELLKILTDLCIEFTQVPKWWYATFVSAGYSQPSGNNQRNNRSEDINQQFSYKIMVSIVDLWVLMVIHDPAKIGIDKFEKWQNGTIKAIRSGRFRENQLDLMPGFKPVLDVIQKITTGQELDSILVMKSRAAFGNVQRENLIDTALDILHSPSEISIPPFNKDKDSKNAQKQRIRQATTESVKYLEKTLFLVGHLIDYSDTKMIAYKLGLHALSLRRPPASSKAMEVKLFFLQSEISDLLKKVNCSSDGNYLEELRKHASLIIAAKEEGWIARPESDGQILPITLGKFIFEALDDSSLTECDRDLGFWCGNTTLGFKLAVSESEYPILCEAVRRQRGDLALKLLIRFKDDKSALGTILDKLLDKSILKNVMKTSIFAERKNISPLPPSPEKVLSSVPRAIRSQSSADDSGSNMSYNHQVRRKSNSRTVQTFVRMRQKRNTCSYINSSASEEAMLSDDQSQEQRFFAGQGALNRTNSPVSSEELRESDSSTDSQDPISRAAREERIPSRDIPQNDVIAQPNPGPSGRPFKSRRIGKGNLVLANTPNAPSDALANFYSDLAKKILEYSGTRSDDGYFQHDGNPNAPPYSRNLHLASFEVQLYALALNNSMTNTWQSRNYSRYGKTVTHAAMEIGSSAIDVLVASWQGHLTPSEAIKLALMASKQSDLQNEMRKSASELALSCLNHCSGLNLRDISNALIQCRDYSIRAFEKAMTIVESNLIDRDSLIPEALFEVSKQWEWLHESLHSDPILHR